jgi:ribosomal protein L31E
MERTKRKRSSLRFLPVPQRTTRALELVKEFVAKHGCESLSKVKYREFHLGHWVAMQRMAFRRGTLPKWLQRELESIPGWTWNPKEALQQRKLAVLREYVQKRGWEEFNTKTVFRDVVLGTWVVRCRESFTKGTLQEWLQVELEQIPGWTWTKPENDRFTRKEKRAIEALRRFVEQHGRRKLRTNTVFEGSNIGRFVKKWRCLYHRGELNKRHQDTLESVPGWSWDSHYREEHHRRVVTLLRDHVAEHGWQGIKDEMRVEGVNLRGWYGGRRAAYRKGSLADWLRQELEAIPGWRWSGRMGVDSEEPVG